MALRLARFPANRQTRSEHFRHHFLGIRAKIRPSPGPHTE